MEDGSGGRLPRFRRRVAGGAALVLFLVFLVGGCGEQKCRGASCPQPICAPASKRACACPMTGAGTEQCALDGMSYGPCLFCPQVLFQETFDTFPSSRWQVPAPLPQGVSRDSTQGNPAPSLLLSGVGGILSSFQPEPLAMTWQLDVQIPDGGSLDVYMNQIGEFQIGLGPDAGPGLMASFVGGSPFPFPSDAAFHRLQFRQAGDGGVVVLIDGDAGTTFAAGVGSVAVIGLGAGVTGPSAPVHVDNVLLTAP